LAVWLVGGSIHLWIWLSQPHCVGAPSHCWPHRSSFQNVPQSLRGWRTLLLQRGLSCSPWWHSHDKTGTRWGESLSGPHSEAPPLPPPQPGPWVSWEWGQDCILELRKNKTSIINSVSNMFVRNKKYHKQM
jgi:hypothetical protein